MQSEAFRPNDSRVLQMMDCFHCAYVRYTLTLILSNALEISKESSGPRDVREDCRRVSMFAHTLVWLLPRYTEVLEDGSFRG